MARMMTRCRIANSAGEIMGGRMDPYAAPVTSHGNVLASSLRQIARPRPLGSAVSAVARPSEETASAEGDLVARGFRAFTVAETKGHQFAIWLKPPATVGRTAWKAAVVSRGTPTFATAYVAEDAVLRASVPIADPRGHLLFRADTRRGEPVAGAGFQCKFGAS